MWGTHVMSPTVFNCGSFGCFFFQAEDGIRHLIVTGVQTCALPISALGISAAAGGAGPLSVASFFPAAAPAEPLALCPLAAAAGASMRRASGSGVVGGR